MATPHISAEKGDFAKTVLMPGDPLRAKFIAENFFTGARLVNNVRGMKGYTGKYRGADISVMASGMGMPSAGIYSYELFKIYDVDNIIRIGTAGALSDELELYDIIVGAGACTNSGFQNQYGLPGNFAPIADYDLMSAFVNKAKARKKRVFVGNLLSSDVFYNADDNANELWRRMGVLAIEMETAAVYMNAAYLKKRALAVCTISDCPFKGSETTSLEREQSFTEMIETALDTAAEL